MMRMVVDHPRAAPILKLPLSPARVSTSAVVPVPVSVSVSVPVPVPVSSAPSTSTSSPSTAGIHLSFEHVLHPIHGPLPHRLRDRHSLSRKRRTGRIVPAAAAASISVFVPISVTVTVSVSIAPTPASTLPSAAAVPVPILVPTTHTIRGWPRSGRP